MKSSIPKFLKLNNSEIFPLKGIGTAGNRNLKQIIPEAIKIGYRSIDTARGYGNESVIGNILGDLYFKNLIKREELYITTKIKNQLKLDVDNEITDSLQKLKTEYIDLLLIHWPVGKIEDWKPLQTPLHIFWKQLENNVKNGRVKSIGLSNFNTQIICDLLSYCDIKPTINQIECHPYHSNSNLINFCQKNEIQVISFAPLCRGGSQVKSALGQIIDVFNESLLINISKKYNRSIGQILLNWNLKRKVGIIPKTEKIDRLKENFEVDDFEISDEDFILIEGLNKNIRTIDPLDKSDYMKNSFKGVPVFD